MHLPGTNLSRNAVCTTLAVCRRTSGSLKPIQQPARKRSATQLVVSRWTRRYIRLVSVSGQLPDTSVNGKITGDNNSNACQRHVEHALSSVIFGCGDGTCLLATTVNYANYYSLPLRVVDTDRRDAHDECCVRWRPAK